MYYVTYKVRDHTPCETEICRSEMLRYDRRLHLSANIAPRGRDCGTYREREESSVQSTSPGTQYPQTPLGLQEPRTPPKHSRE